MSQPEIQLNSFGARHVEQTFAWVSQPELQQAFMIRGEITWAGHQAYFASVLADELQHVYAITMDGAHVGNGGFKDLDIAVGQGELWIYLGEPSVRGKGIGKLALRLLLDEGANRLGLRRVIVHVADSNTPARHLYESVGFAACGEGRGEWSRRGMKIIQMAWTAS